MGDNGDQGEDVRAQAADWFARLKSVPVSRETLEEFFAWRRIDRHAAAFDEVERFWSQAGTVGDQPSVLAATQDAYDRGKKARRDPLGFNNKLIPAIIGAILLSALVLSVAWPRSGDRYATRVGEQSTITLDDGSKMTLDTDTRLTVRYSTEARRISLEQGQAYFTVAHNAARPFTVDADGTEVRATGTQFEVRRLAGATDVTLIEGSVDVRYSGGEPTQLASGEKFSLRDDRPPVVRKVDTSADTAWKRGRIVFDGATLADAIAEVNRYTTRPVRLDADRYADHRFSGSFETGDVASFVTAATALLPVKAVTQSDGSTSLIDPAAKVN